jgi:DNA-binding NarL/FixJ family response regulator
VLEGAQNPVPNPGRLSPREIQVLELASRGLTNGEVAAGLNVSVHAVKFHLAAIYRKLGVANRTEAASTYLRGAAGLNLPPSQLD